ncbi:MAG: Holliday junction resolvase RuvX [Candidatus Paceibacterota bacterium]|jgi:putative Holliday junction resolvase
MKILGIDYGDKRIGLAIAEDTWIRPEKTISNKSIDDSIRLIDDFIKSNNIDVVVFGLPLPFNNNKNERFLITKAFGDKLKHKVSVPFEFISEIFTSKLAINASYTKKQKISTDERAACFILEAYLSKNAKNVNVIKKI